MPMIARSPVLVSWQKTTCSWSPGEGPSLWGIANTFVTVATLLIPSRLCSAGIGIKRIACPAVGPPRGARADALRTDR
jgi:hypothetical protein